MKDFDELVSTIQPLVKNMGAKGIAEVLWGTGYRLDPYPNGKSKGELLAIIDAKEAELARARVEASNLRMGLERVDRIARQYISNDAAQEIRRVSGKYLAETSTVKS